MKSTPRPGRRQQAAASAARRSARPHRGAGAAVAGTSPPTGGDAARPAVRLDCGTLDVMVHVAGATPPLQRPRSFVALDLDTRLFVGFTVALGEPVWPLLLGEVFGLDAARSTAGERQQPPRVVVTDSSPLFTDGGLTKALAELGIDHEFADPRSS